MATAAHVTGTIELGTLPTDVFVKPVHVLTTANPQVVIWPCERCWDEEGRIAMWSHVAGGVCFKCNGAGGVEMPRAEAETKAARLIKSRTVTARANERKRLAKLAKRDAVKAALLAEHPGLAVFENELVVGGNVRVSQVPADAPEAHVLGVEEDWTGEGEPWAAYIPLGSFVAEMGRTFRYTPEWMTPKRIEAALAAVAREQAKAAAKVAKVAAAVLPEAGKFEITGVVGAVWEKEEYFGYSTRYVTKMRVETPGGWVAIGTAPAKLIDAVCAEADANTWRSLRGRTVAFVAEFEPARKQEQGELPVGFYKRPSKVRLIQA